MQLAERIVMVALVLVLLGGVAWFYFATQFERSEFRAAVAAGEFERPVETSETPEAAADWEELYPNTVPITIGDVPVAASVADTMSSRIKGLSDKPYLPENVVKLFAFGVAGQHSIWMKDMNFALDVLWVAEDGEIVHIEENLTPESFPDSFASPVPAHFVIETNAGFVASNTIGVGEEVVLPSRD